MDDYHSLVGGILGCSSFFFFSLSLLNLRTLIFIVAVENFLTTNSEYKYIRKR
jgi:hypothetical protein